jgi:hypothetical protein
MILGLRGPGRLAVTALLAVAALVGSAGCASGAGQVIDRAPRLHVSGNRLVNSRDARVVLRGVVRSGGEFMCVQGHGIWDGPMSQASVNAMKAWHVTAVRIPLNEACWNGDSYVKPAYRGAAYQQAVEAYVRLLNRNGIVAILTLTWTDGGYTGPSANCPSARAVCQKPMPDTGAVPFWTSVARTFKGNDSVLFDLFNEPYPERAAGASASEGWSCWRDGGTCTGIRYQVAGMQALVNAVRSTGANNVLMLGGLEYANDMSQWLAYKPVDRDHNLVASWHSYAFNTCSIPSCWDATVAPVIARVPLIAGEIGEKNCTDSYLRQLLPWLDAQHSGYLAFAWNADFPCGPGPSLITSYSGTPTHYGRGYRDHLLSVRPLWAPDRGDQAHVARLAGAGEAIGSLDRGQHRVVGDGLGVPARPHHRADEDRRYLVGSTAVVLVPGENQQAVVTGCPGEEASQIRAQPPVAGRDAAVVHVVAHVRDDERHGRQPGQVGTGEAGERLAQ